MICALLAQIVDRVTTRPSRQEQAGRPPTQPLGKEGGFELIRKDRYLLLIALLTVLLNVVNTSGEYLFGRYVVEQAQRPVRHRRRRRPRRASASSARPTAGCSAP